MRWIACVVLAASPTLAQPAEVGRSFFDDNEIILFDDQTWAFVEPGIDVTAIAVDACLSSINERVTFCNPPEMFNERRGFSYDGYRDVTFDNLGTAVSLMVGISHGGGHRGEFDSYAMVGSGGLALNLLARLVDIPTYQERVKRVDDIILLEGHTSDAELAYHTYTLDILFAEESITFDLASVIGGGGITDAATIKANYAAALAQLHDAVLVDGVPFSILLKEPGND